MSSKLFRCVGAKWQLRSPLRPGLRARATWNRCESRFGLRLYATYSQCMDLAGMCVWLFTECLLLRSAYTEMRRSQSGTHAPPGPSARTRTRIRVSLLMARMGRSNNPSLHFPLFNNPHWCDFESATRLANIQVPFLRRCLVVAAGEFYL